MKQQRLDLLFTKHYDHILSVATNIVSKKGANKKDNKYTLLHEVYILLLERLPKHHSYLKSDTDFLKYVTSVLKKFYFYKQAICFNKKKDNQLFTYHPSEDDKPNFYDIPDHADQLIFIDSENIPDLTKLFLKDLLSNDITIDKGLQVLKITEAAKHLNETDTLIFDLFFMQSYTCLDIYNELKDLPEYKAFTYPFILQRQKEIKRQIIELIK